MKRHFASLDEYEALHIAICIEERNAHLYDNLAQRFAEYDDDDSQAVAATFREMAEQERDHGTLLQERYYQRFGNQPCTLTDADVFDVIELPRLLDGEEFVARSVNRRQAVEIALAAESQARHYYTELAALTLEAPLRGLYQELAGFERDHEEFLEQKLRQLKRSGKGD